jgi:hypothetical protein
MKRIFLGLSFMGVFAFATVQAWAGPSSLSDKEMDTFYAKGIQVSGTGTGGTGGTGGAGGLNTPSDKGAGHFDAKKSHPPISKSHPATNANGGTGKGGGGGNGNDGIDARHSDVGLAAAKDKSQAVGKADDVGQAKHRSVAVGDMHNGALANDHSNASDNPKDSAVAQDRSRAYRVGDVHNGAIAQDRSNASDNPKHSAVAQEHSTAYNASNIWDSAVAVSRSSAIRNTASYNAFQVRVSGDNAFNSQQNQIYLNDSEIYNQGGQTVNNVNIAHSEGGLAFAKAPADAPAKAINVPLAAVAAVNYRSGNGGKADADAWQESPHNSNRATGGNVDLREADKQKHHPVSMSDSFKKDLGSKNDGDRAGRGGSGDADASKVKQTAANINAAVGGEGYSDADASKSTANAEGNKAHANPYADAKANADASARSHATINNEKQNNLNKSVQLRGDAQNYNSGNIVIGVQSTIAQQVNATSASHSSVYGGQTLQGNAIAVNTFNN